MNKLIINKKRIYLGLYNRLYSSIVIANESNVKELYQNNEELLIEFKDLDERQLNDEIFLCDSLKSWCNMGNKDMAEQYCHQLIKVNESSSSSQILNIDPLFKLYNNMMDMESGHKLMKQIDIKKQPLSTWSYAFYINMLGKSKDIETAEEIFEFLKKQGQLSTIIFDHMITLYKRVGQRKKAEELFKSMSMYHIDATNVTYGLLIETQIKDGQGSRALRTFKQMLKNGLTPTSIAYRNLLQYFHDLNDLRSFDDVVNHLHENMEVKHIEANVYSVIIESYLSNNRLHEAQKCVELLKENLYPLNLYLCRESIETYLRLGLVTEAIQIYEQLIEQNVTPNIPIYSAFLTHLPSSYGRTLAVQLIQQLVADMKKYEIIYEETLKDQLVHVYSRFSCEFLEELLNEYEKMEIKIKAQYHAALLKSYRRAFKYQEAIEYLQNLESLKDKSSLSIDSFNAVASLYLHRKNNVKARQTLQRALNKYEISPNGWTHEILIQIAFLEQKYGRAVKHYDSLMKRGYEPDEMTIKTMRRILVDRKDVGRLKEMRKILHDIELGVRSSYASK